MFILLPPLLLQLLPEPLLVIVNDCRLATIYSPHFKYTRKTVCEMQSVKNSSSGSVDVSLSAICSSHNGQTVLDFTPCMLQHQRCHRRNCSRQCIIFCIVERGTGSPVLAPRVQALKNCSSSGNGSHDPIVPACELDCMSYWIHRHTK
jgi:hypothetical protein